MCLHKLSLVNHARAPDHILVALLLSSDSFHEVGFMQNVYSLFGQEFLSAVTKLLGECGHEPIASETYAHCFFLAIFASEVSCDFNAHYSSSRY
jgi:hypothetical protein